MKRIYFCFAFLLILFYSALSVSAQTIVSGSISDGTVWNASGSPYIFSETVELPAGATLTIEPGTVIKADGEFTTLEIYGAVNAIGTQDDRISFTSLKDDAVGGDTNADGSATAPKELDWGALNFQAGSSAQFLYTNIGYGHVTAYDASFSFDRSTLHHGQLVLYGETEAVIKDAAFEDAKSTALEIGEDATVLVERSTIARAGRNALSTSGGTTTLSHSSIVQTKPGQFGKAIQMTFGSELSINDSTLDGGTIGINVMGPNKLTMANSVVKNFSDTGILDTVGVVIVGRVPANSQYDGADIAITRSEITSNGTGLILRDDSTLSVHDNSIHGNALGADALVLENNWWGDASGPHDAVGNPSGTGDEVPEYLDYTPWLLSDPLLVPEVTCCSSVAFLPGIQASRLYSGAEGGEKLWEPFGNNEVRKLYMNAQGESIDPTIYTEDVVDTFKAFNLGGPSIYGGFIDEMNDLVDEGTIAGWKALPYDWRASVSDVVENGVKLAGGPSDMGAQVEALAANSKSGKVTIIAHSNGGLVAKALMQKLEEEGKEALVDKIIFVAVPQLGTPDAVKILLHGMNIGAGMIFDNETARKFAENMPAAYGLLPTERYFDEINDPVVVFDPSVDEMNNFIDVHGAAIEDKQTLDNFLLGTEGRTKPISINLNAPNVLNRSLLQRANVLHGDLDAWEPPEGVELIQIAGWGMNTVKGVKYFGKFPCSKLITIGPCAPYIDPEPIITTEGDRTVIYPSAVYLGAEKYYFDIDAYNSANDKNIDHKNILEAQSLLNFISNEVENIEEEGEFITNIRPNVKASEKRILISMHSPASISLYDEEGNHTGLIPNTISDSDFLLYEENIPNSFYMEFGESKYAGFEAQEGNRVKIQGTGAGTFTFVVEERAGDEVVDTTMFTDIPVTPDLKAEYTVSGEVQTLVLDIDGNGTKDFDVKPSEQPDPILFFQMLKKSIISLKLPSFVEKLFLQKIDKAIKIIEKDPKKKEKAIAFIKWYTRTVEEKKWKKTNKLSTEQKAALIVMMNGLVDNIK